MKLKTVSILAVAFTFAICSCKKTAVIALDKTTPVMDSVIEKDSVIAGKWNLISDSTFTGIGSNNHPLNYTGRPGDYFDFNFNGTVYTKEGAALDTLSYQVTSDSTVIIESFGIILNGNPEVSQLLNITAHSVTINAPVELTPGGEFGRKVMLSR